MKGYRGVILGVLILNLSIQGLAFAQLPKKMKAVKESPASTKYKTDLLSEAKLRLSKRDWIVICNPLDLAKTSFQTTDVLTFSEERFTSKNLSAQGFVSVPYTLALQEDGSITWEAILENEKIGVVFWRGKLKDNSLSGFFTVLSNEGELKDFSFQSLITAG
ncbi:MAG: hypothetical protein NC912_05180 [Candidatus Omnitrophica bacterium]|nr:hypothetical protein [Candidatus Omnitrophota bacterium]